MLNPIQRLGRGNAKLFCTELQSHVSHVDVGAEDR